MIIQCPKCETQYRFDDSEIDGDGFWVRCTRCKNVFFQPRPVDHRRGETAEISSVRISDSRRGGEDRLRNGSDEPETMAGSSVIPEPPIVNDPFPPENEPIVNFGKESFASVSDSENSSGDTEPSGAGELKTEKPSKREDAPQKTKKRQRRWVRIILAATGFFLLIAIIAGGVVWWIYPDTRDSLIKDVSPWIRGVPFLEELAPVEKPAMKMSYDMLHVKDLRQRTVTNIISGSLQVIEGSVVNQSGHPVSGIKMRLVIADPYDAVLGQKVAYGGNILTDEELVGMTEAEIQRELSLPMGSDFPNARILPNGEIPFMIVFTHDSSSGAIKTAVTVVGGESAP